MVDKLVLIGMFLLLLLLLWLLLQLLNNKQEKAGQSGQGSGNTGSSLDSDESAEESYQATQAALRKLVKATKSPDAETAQMAQESLQQLMRRAGMGHGDLQDVSHESEMVRALARQLELETVQGYSEAVDIKLPTIKAQRTVTKERSLFPTLDADMQPAQTPEEMLAGATPEQLYQREKTYDQLAKGELPVVTYYQSQVTEAVLHLLIDVSGSMGEPMNNGMLKRIMARAVVYHLLTRATRGNAKFLLRFFDGRVHPLRVANNAQEAAELATEVTDKGFSGSGTEILGAIKKAAEDIREAMKASPKFEAEILIISDGQSNTSFTEDELRAVLKDIKLHVIMIGDEENDVLETVASSFQRKN